MPQLRKLLFIILLFVLGKTFALGKENIQDSLLTAIQNSDIKIKVEAYKGIVDYYQNYNLELAINYAEKAIKIAEANNLENDYADFLFKLGNAKHKQSQYLEAVTLFKQAEDVYLTLADSVGYGKSLCRIGRLYVHLGEFEDALDYCFRSIRVLEYQNDKVALADAYNFYGIIFYILKEYEKAEKLSVKALKFSETVGDDLVLAQSHEHLCIIKIHQQKFEEAAEHANIAQKLREKHSEKWGQAGAYANLAIINRMMKNYDKAIEYYNKALKIQTEINHPGGIASSLAGLARTYLYMNRYKESLKYAKEAYKLRKDQNNRRGVVSSLTLLSEIFSKMKDYETSLEYFKLSKVHNDSLLSEKKNEKVAVLQEKYEHENRTKEILLLQKENVIQKHTQIYLMLIITILLGCSIFIFAAYRSKKTINVELKLSNDKIFKQKEELQLINTQLHELNVTKDKFFSIIAHDLKSPFQGLLGLLRILDKDIKELTINEVEESVSLVKNSADNMYDLLENLLEWANVQRGNLVFNKNPLSVYSLADEIIKNHKPVADSKNIKIVNNISKEIIVDADFEMLCAVLRNLLSNAIKFSWKDSSINLNSKNLDGAYQFSVSDNGIGLNEDMISSLFKIDEKTSRLGTEGEKSTGLGLILCKEYIDRHHGKIWAESNENKGSTFYFTIPEIV
ncbi:MAG: tetratricopeptide repeat-containing sensor histidine kinase [Melioribacteraceae bacterium]|nr:tetratricopeptide repeat-containing sensor histidine kinase [Melioribacteraceae bacterium]